MQPPRSDESIASIVALAAENHDAPHRTVMREHVIRNRGARVFHQRERGHAEAIASCTIDGAHLFSSNNFHAIPWLG
jgi:hypothetical protein